MVHGTERRAPGVRVDFEHVEYMSILTRSGYNASVGQVHGHYRLVQVSREVGHNLLQRSIRVIRAHCHMFASICRARNSQDVDNSDYPRRATAAVSNSDLTANKVSGKKIRTIFENGQRKM